MNIQHYENPWPHFEVKNFLLDDEKKVLEDYAESLEKPESKQKYFATGLNNFSGEIAGINYKNHLLKAGSEKSRIERKQKEKFEPTEVDKNIFYMLSKSFLNLCENINFNYCKKNPLIQIEFNSFSSDYDYYMHLDARNKPLVFIYHLSDKGLGTDLHSTPDGPCVKTTNWIPNGGSGFLNHRKAWHTYTNKGQDYVRQSIHFAYWNIAPNL